MRTATAMLCAAALFAAGCAASGLPANSAGSLLRRDDFTEACSDLSVAENKGDRKVAIVIDSSGSMLYNDYNDLRLVAGRALSSFLVSSTEANSNSKADQVTVVDFDDEAQVIYPLGDPGSAANASFAKIDSYGGTYIALGVRTALAELTKAGSGATDKRSAIVVFTDGEDSSTTELVDAINNATAAGIRVSFGFLDTSASQQDKRIQAAIRASRGVYATITLAAGSQNYINYVILNGLTYNDNPQGYDAQLLAGLAETHVISGSSTLTLKYAANAGENINFRVTSITSGRLTATASMGGQTLNTTASALTSTLIVKAPSTGTVEVKVTASGAPQDSLFSVLTNSNVPLKNCTVGVGSRDAGLSTGAKAGIGVGVTAVVLGLGALGGYFAWKHFHPANPVPLSGGEGMGHGSGVGADPNGAGMGHGPADPNTTSYYAGGAEKPFVNSTSYPVGNGPLNPAPPPAPYGPMGNGPPPGMGVAPGGNPVPFFAIPPPFFPPGHPNNPNNNQPNSTNRDALGDQPANPNHTGSTGPYYPPQQQYPGYNNGMPSPPSSLNHTGYGGNPSPYNPTPSPNSVGHPSGFNPTPGGGQEYYNPAQPPSSLDPNHTNFAPPPQMDSPADYHDADNCSCYSGASDSEGPGGQTPLYVPGAPPLQPGKHRHQRARRPKLRRKDVARHHHHEWTGPAAPCADAACVLGRRDHYCVDYRSCACTCRDDACPVTKQRLADRRRVGAVEMGAAGGASYAAENGL